MFEFLGMFWMLAQGFREHSLLMNKREKSAPGEMKVRAMVLDMLMIMSYFIIAAILLEAGIVSVMEKV